MKNVLLIGLGRFGRHMAQKLHDLNHQVLASPTPRSATPPTRR